MCGSSGVLRLPSTVLSATFSFLDQADFAIAHTCWHLNHIYKLVSSAPHTMRIVHHNAYTTLNDTAPVFVRLHCILRSIRAIDIPNAERLSRCAWHQLATILSSQLHASRTLSLDFGIYTSFYDESYRAAFMRALPFVTACTFKFVDAQFSILNATTSLTRLHILSGGIQADTCVRTINECPSLTNLRMHVSENQLALLSKVAPKLKSLNLIIEHDAHVLRVRGEPIYSTFARQLASCTYLEVDTFRILMYNHAPVVEHVHIHLPRNIHWPIVDSMESNVLSHVTLEGGFVDDFLLGMFVSNFIDKLDMLRTLEFRRCTFASSINWSILLQFPKLDLVIIQGTKPQLLASLDMDKHWASRPIKITTFLHE